MLLGGEESLACLGNVKVDRPGVSGAPGRGGGLVKGLILRA